jgi:F-type H+-transporting ATPase subunit b
LIESKHYLRFSCRLSGIALLVALAVAMFFAPARAVAQEPGSQPQAVSPASATQPSAQPNPALTDDEKQNNAFRLEGPVVKWTAKTLNLPIEATARGFEVINFLIIVLAIAVPLFRFLPRFLRGRAAKVKSDIESARKVTEDANTRLSAVEAKLASLGEEIQKFRTEVEAESAGEARIKASLEDESARIVVAAEQEIDQAAAQARRGLRTFAADLAIDQAAKSLVLTAETDRALIAEFVGDVIGKGGSN